MLSCQYPAELARAALETAILRLEAKSKFPFSERLYFTRQALEQASSFEVASYRAERFRPFELVADLGCSIGGDTLALAAHSFTVGIDIDPLRLSMAAANLRALGLGLQSAFVRADLAAPLPLSNRPEAALFFMVGILQQRAHTREMGRFQGLLEQVPVYSGLLGVLAFGSLGLPGLSGFIAEFQVVGATLPVSLIAAVLALFGVILTTGLYIRVLINVVMGKQTEGMPKFADLERRELATVVPLALLSVLIGLLPGVILPVIDATTRFLAGFPGR